MLYFTGPMLLFTLICLVFFIPYGLLIAWYYRAWKAIPIYSQGACASAPRTRISVLIPARNEAANIGDCLGSLSLQSYPKHLYEVIVIDDHSTDRTAGIVQGFDYPDMRIICLKLADRIAGGARVNAYKKLAIETGIQTATGELIVTTDADCRFPPDWLWTIAAFREETGAKFIAAPVRIGEPDPATGNNSSPVRKRNASFLATFQILDFISLQGITGAAVYKKFHSMCNGANLAYTREAFYEVDGFRGIDDIPSGDDMLLMHKIYKKHPEQVFFLKNPQAIVSTQAAENWSEFINQRIRWASKADRYDDKRIFWVLLLVYLVNLLFLVILLASFWNGRYLWIFLFLLILKTMIEFPFVRSAAIFFRQQRRTAWFPAMQPFHILYTVVIGWLGKFGSYRWKDRRSDQMHQPHTA